MIRNNSIALLGTKTFVRSLTKPQTPVLRLKRSDSSLKLQLYLADYYQFGGY